MLLLMGAPTGANGSRYKASRGAPRDLGALRLFLIEAPSGLLLKALRGALMGLLDIAAYELHLVAPIGASM